MISFISGGVRSGKSTFAERMALSCYEKKEGNTLYYIATSMCRGDREMEVRIKRHQNGRGDEWTTVEEPFEIGLIMGSIETDSVVLIDCLTVWTSNVLFEEGKNARVLLARMQQLVDAAKEKNISLILVSNDLNEELPIRDPFVQSYIRSLEAVHAFAAAWAEQAVQVIAGHPVYWKGGEGQL